VEESKPTTKDGKTETKMEEPVKVKEIGKKVELETPTIVRMNTKSESTT